MYDGNGDITTSDYRMTVEKRDGGIIAWRFIAGETDEHDADRDRSATSASSINFNPAQTYFWRATLGRRLLPRRDLPGRHRPANRIYEFGKGYHGTYDPTPHVAFLGSPIGRGGADDASVVGATWRNVYLGSSRPAASDLAGHGAHRGSEPTIRASRTAASAPPN